MPTTANRTSPHVPPPTAAHEHGWSVVSRHPTSEGIVLYVRCAECAALRVDRQERRDAPPVALSRAASTRIRHSAPR